MTKISNKKLNVPNLRFPEFGGEWQVRKVSDLLEFYTTNSLSWEQLSYDDGNIHNLHYGLIHKGLPTNVCINNQNLPYVKKGCEPNNFTVCKNGDIVFADASEDTNDVAKAVEFINCADKAIICGLHTIHGRDKAEETAIGYKGYAFASTKFHEQVRRIAQGTKVYSISQKNFAELYIGVPTKAEQQKIASLLSLIDERIATQMKIIDSLESLIKGLSYYYLGESCDFEYLKFISTIEKGAQINKESLSVSGRYYVMNGGVTPSGYCDSFNTDANTISISEGGNSCGYVQYNTVPFWSGGHCYTLKNIDTDVNVKYLFYYLKLNESKIMALRVGSGLPNIQKSALSAFRIPIPPLEEQLKIVNALDCMSAKIENEKGILSAYKRQKEHLLREMFI